MTYPSRAVMDGAEPVRRYRDVMALPDDFVHTRGSGCPCRPSIESGAAGDVIVHRRYGAGRERPVSEMHACDICGHLGRKTVRFSLVRQVHAAGRKTTRGAGALDLCQECWTQYAKPAMRAPSDRRRPRLRVVA